jgi:uncharacterized membrane protein YsdA (DUF1294 family)
MTMRIALACVFLALVFGLALAGDLPIAVAVLYLAASVTAFALYRADKAAAVNERRRTAEDTLLAVGLLGGWPGALVAQDVLRHKSRKAGFQVMFWATVVLNCAVLGWFWSGQR